MPWKVDSTMSLRREFVTFASARGANFSKLCERYKISRKTGYKWLDRSRASPDDLTGALSDRSRRPHASPKRIEAAVEKRIVELRGKHPAWGARKLRRRMLDLGQSDVPAASVVHDVLVRNGLIDPDQSSKHRPFERFEREEPNDLWQMDFKGYILTDDGVRCHPLTALDDHSRFNLVLKACGDQQIPTVKAALIEAFERYGLPRCLLSDNGPPWGSYGQDNNWTRLGAWLVRLGITLIHGRPNHPQTQGKEERFHRTLTAEAIGTRRFRDLAEAQAAFDAYRPVYNQQRPHEALGLATPATRYYPATRLYDPSAATRPLEYAPGDAVRKVDAFGRISYRGTSWKVGTAFIGERVAVRPAGEAEGECHVFYCHQRVAKLQLRDETEPR
jgi:transposase InsO family protein